MDIQLKDGAKMNVQQRDTISELKDVIKMKDVEIEQRALESKKKQTENSEENEIVTNNENNPIPIEVS